MPKLLRISSGAFSVLDTIANEWEDCDKCPLSALRSRVVFIRGRVPADLILVGEAPGEAEDTNGYPFIGEAGSVLDQWLEIAMDEAETHSRRIRFQGALHIAFWKNNNFTGQM